MRDESIAGNMSGRWYVTPAVFAAFGVLAIILLLWIERLGEKLIHENIIEDAIMDLQNYTALFHLRLEEAMTGKVPVTADEAFGSLDQAIKLVDATLKGGESQNKWISKPLTDPGQRARAEEIKSLLMKFRVLGLERRQKSDVSGSGSSLEQEFHMVFAEVLNKARGLEAILEKEEAEKQKEIGRIFFSITAILVFLVTAATAGLWNREKKRRRAEEELAKANAQLLSQTEELTLQRQNLEELVEGRTAELETTNRELEKEIGEHVKTEEALEESKKRLMFLSSQLITTQETERGRISRELHDELGQALTLIKLRLRLIEQNFGKDQMGIRKECEETLAYIDQLIENVRRLSLDLSPSILERLGLTAAIRSLIDGFAATYVNIAVTSDITDIDHLFPRESHVHIYRMLQEALTNVAKHAQAGKVRVVAAVQRDQVSLSVEDNGSGFAANRSLVRDVEGKGLGLAIMNERVRMLKGTLDLRSEEGRGTRMTISIPVEKAV